MILRTRKWFEDRSHKNDNDRTLLAGNKGTRHTARFEYRVARISGQKGGCTNGEEDRIVLQSYTRGR